jgi:LruC domain-containing protein
LVSSVSSNNEAKRSGSESNRASNGTDADVTDKATIIVFNQGQKLVPYLGRYYNTEMAAVKGDADTLTVTTTFTTNSVTIASLGAVPFNPFIFTNHDRTREVHLVDNKPTSAANVALFGKEQDKSVPASGSYYKSKNNMPFALHFASNWQYPIEKANITAAYKRFAPWAQSLGTTDKNWYSGTGSYYRNVTNIYSK